MAPNVRRQTELRKDGQQRSLTVRKGPYRGDVSALCLVWSQERHLLLAGTGAQVLLYDLVTGDRLSSRNVFDGVRVHGIYSGPAFGKGSDSPASQVAFKMGTIAIHGERRVKLFKMVWFLENETPQLQALGSLPRFSHWVMDVRILQENRITSKTQHAADVKDLHLLAVGLSNNTICIWDLLNSAIICRVECSERCLLYSMRLWGDSLESLYAGAGTVFNEVLVWRLGSNIMSVRKMLNVVTEYNLTEHERGEKGAQDKTPDTWPELVNLEEVVPLQRLLGHEGSIHRLTWSTDGLSLVSVADDRSARVWCAKKSTTGHDPWLEVVAGPVLYGHGSRLWDCDVGEKLLITVSEDCTCRIWTVEGKYLAALKGHIGRGIWRCVYDPEMNSLVTAGADSSIKVQSLDKWIPRARNGETEQDINLSIQREDVQSFSIIPPWLNGVNKGSSGFLDSKSEYVRCLGLSNPWSLYVGTNQGAVYHVHLQTNKEALWSLLMDDLQGPIVCMDVLLKGDVKDGSFGRDSFPDVDMVVVGTGKGRVSAMEVRRTVNMWHCAWRYTWVAESEQQLLGVHFCKSLGGRHVFTTDARGVFRMWHVSEGKDLSNGSTQIHSSFSPLTSFGSEGEEDCSKYMAHLVAYGRGSHARITCIDVCPDLQLLVCGDNRGGLSVFSLPKYLWQWTVDEKEVPMNTETGAAIELPTVSVFKGAHGISAIASVSALPSKLGQQAEIISTGSDGCICRFLLDQNLAAEVPQHSKDLIFVGIEKLAALSIVESLEYCKALLSQKRAERRIAAGFTGSDFMLWDLTHQCEVLRVTCGGWRRPHSVLVGDLPEQQYCFVFVKDQVMHVQQHWVTTSESGRRSACENSSFSKRAPRISMQSLQGQFHGKEISSVLFLDTSNSMAHVASHPISWIATGSEDGTVLISRYTEGPDEQLDSIAVLGDHVGGSAVRALASVTKIHLGPTAERQNPSLDSVEGKRPLVENSTGSSRDKELLFSAGAKEVLTCWLLDWLPEVDELSLDLCGSVAKLSTSIGEDAPLPMSKAPSSQWLSTHVPRRVHPCVAVMTSEEKKIASVRESDKQENLTVQDNSEHRKEQDSSTRLISDDDNDQRYLALTAFGTRCVKTGTLISFVATSSSNATLHLYAFHVTHRSWAELAVLQYNTALVLSIEHFIAPFSSYGGQDAYIIITGAANGNIALWDVTNVVNEYCNSDDLDVNKALGAPLRPLTGRGSQGGRRRRKPVQQPNACLNPKCSEGKSVGMEKRHDSDPGGLVFLPEDQIESPNEEKANRVSKSSNVQESKEFIEEKPSVRLNPLQELMGAHQSGINCMTVARIQNTEKFASDKITYVLISGGDDQGLHMAMVTLEMKYLKDFGNAQGLNTGSSSAPMSPVLQCLSISSVPCAHNSSVKGVWTDGVWAFSTGLDQRLRCWTISTDLQPDSGEGDNSIDARAASPLLECMISVIDVPEPSSLHVKHCLGGLYQIAVVGRGLQVIHFDSNSLSS